MNQSRESWRLGSAGARALATLTALSACAGAPTQIRPLHLETSIDGNATRVVLVADSGYRVSARLKPALELAGGGVVRFDAAAVTPDRAYFTAPPSARLPGRHDQVHGTLRASVCEVGEEVCRTVVMRL